MAGPEVIHAYRNLLRSFLRAVRFSKPARYIGLEQLRTAFREKNAQYNADGIRRTRWFLEAAARERGLEHRIVRNLIRVHYERKREGTIRWKPKDVNAARKMYENLPPRDAYYHYEKTIHMLNESMGTLLR